MLAILAVGTRTGNVPLVFLDVPAWWLATSLAILALPSDCFPRTKLKPVIPNLPPNSLLPRPLPMALGG